MWFLSATGRLALGVSQVASWAPLCLERGLALASTPSGWVPDSDVGLGTDPSPQFCQRASQDTQHTDTHTHPTHTYTCTPHTPTHTYTQTQHTHTHTPTHVHTSPTHTYTHPTHVHTPPPRTHVTLRGLKGSGLRVPSPPARPQHRRQVHSTAREDSKMILFHYYPSTFEKIIVQVSA